MRYRIAAVLVLYHPDANLMQRVVSYIEHVEVLYAIDNTDGSDANVQALLMNHRKIVYVGNGANLGIAAALNQGANLAIEKGCDFLLTMDQDSFFADGPGVAALINKLYQFDVNSLGILSPMHHHPTLPDRAMISGTEQVGFVMTSGNLLNLHAFKAVGPFDEALFIDHVDHEFCFRLISHNYKVFLDHDVKLTHALGTVKKMRLFGFTIMKFVSHSPVRTYYMIRNGLAVAKKYEDIFPEFRKKNFSLILKEIGKIPFETDKLERIKLAWLAIKHFRLKRSGKLIL